MLKLYLVLVLEELILKTLTLADINDNSFKMKAITINNVWWTIINNGLC